MSEIETGAQVRVPSRARRRLVNPARAYILSVEGLVR